MVLHRVLGGDHHEGLREVVRLAVDADLVFVHRLKQRRLGLGRGAVDLVGQQEVAENGPGFELEGFRVRVVDGDAEHVAGQHVAGELEAVEAAGDRPGQGPAPGWSCRTPGTSSMSKWPRASRQTRESLTTSALPRIAGRRADSSSASLARICGENPAGGASIDSRWVITVHDTKDRRGGILIARGTVAKHRGGRRARSRSQARRCRRPAASKAAKATPARPMVPGSGAWSKNR